MNRLSQTAILMHMNTDEAATKPLAKKYHLGGIPTVVVIDPQGLEVDRIIGYDDDRSAWLKTLLAYLYGIDTVQDLQARFETKPDVVMAHDLAQKYLDRGDGTNALVWVDKSRALKPDAGTANKLTLIQGEAWLITDPAKGTEALLGLATAPDNALGIEAFQALSAFYKRQARNASDPEEKKKAKAARLEVFHKVVAARPSDPDVLSEYAWYCAAEGIELDRALAAAQKASEVKKDDAETLSVLAEVAFKANKKEMALQTIDRAIALSPEESFFKEQKEKFSKKDEAKP
jgi:tetratricopeptide (TPR) repeat protein